MAILGQQRRSCSFVRNHGLTCQYCTFPLQRRPLRICRLSKIVKNDVLAISYMLDWGRSVIRLESHCERASLGNDKISSFVLISMSVTSDDDRVVPGCYKSRNVGAENRLAENRSTKDVPDRSIW